VGKGELGRRSGRGGGRGQGKGDLERRRSDKDELGGRLRLLAETTTDVLEETHH
jgi:hypothetical protein